MQKTIHRKTGTLSRKYALRTASGKQVYCAPGYMKYTLATGNGKFAFRPTQANDAITSERLKTIIKLAAAKQLNETCDWVQDGYVETVSA